MSKIVRDRIPEIIRGAGRIAVCETVSDEEMLKGLKEKLVEEAREFAESGETEELADVMEVVWGLMRLRGETMADVERLRLQKRAERGGFEKNIRLLSVKDAGAEDQK